MSEIKVDPRPPKCESEECEACVGTGHGKWEITEEMAIRAAEADERWGVRIMAGVDTLPLADRGDVYRRNRVKRFTAVLRAALEVPGDA